MESTAAAIQDWLRPLTISNDTLKALTLQLSSTYKHLALHSDNQFLPTPVTRLPNGKEKGLYLAIDFGGSNLRIAFVNLLGAGKPPEGGGQKGHHDAHTVLTSADDSYAACFASYHERSWSIEERLKADNADDLFRWVGGCLAQVIQEYIWDVQWSSNDRASMPEEIPLGITFSFPMIQTTLSRATLMPMGKGFTVGSKLDLASMVLAGYGNDRCLPRLKILAITNDAVATLVSLTYAAGLEPCGKAVAGLILGTGTNAAVAMDAALLNESKRPSLWQNLEGQQVVVNTEWTINGVAAPLRDMDIITRWDETLDEALSAPGFQPFESLTAGKYLGEIVRLVVLEYFLKRLKLKKESLPPFLLCHYGMTTEFLARVVATSDNASDLAARLTQGDHFPNSNHFFWTPKLAEVLRLTERAVIRRSVCLIGAAVVGLLGATGDLDLMGRVYKPQMNGVVEGTSKPSKKLIVAYLGGLIMQYRGYKEQTQSVINLLLGDFISHECESSVQLVEAAKGGLFGAAALAASATLGHVSENQLR
ncbi:MAG: hypothetical protein MMC33_010034 [Icmadophila ericetorum]|nr:hypothetical protein [Icmadophila ericetorum]